MKFKSDCSTFSAWSFTELNKDFICLLDLAAAYPWTAALSVFCICDLTQPPRVWWIAFVGRAQWITRNPLDKLKEHSGLCHRQFCAEAVAVQTTFESEPRGVSHLISISIKTFGSLKHHRIERFEINFQVSRAHSRSRWERSRKGRKKSP